MTGNNELVVSAIQITAVDGEIEATWEKVSRLLDIAGERGSDLVVLPEVWTGLSYSEGDLYRETAETIPGPSTDLLAEKPKNMECMLSVRFMSGRTMPITMPHPSSIHRVP
jgi:predicted amidohydrolase